jgi:putative membrane protein
MKDIFLAVLSTTWNRKESKLFLLFSLIPILYLASTFMETSFMNVTSIETGAKLSFLEMYDGIFNLSFNSTLPTLSLFLLILSVVRSDIELHRLFLYKDIERKKILLSKILSILSLFALFVLIFSLLMFGVYYLRIIHLPFASGEFLGQDSLLAIFSIFGTILHHVFYIFLLTMISLFFSNVASIVSGIILLIFTGILPLFGKIGLIFPNGFRLLAEEGNFHLAYIGIISITTFYSLILFYFSLKKFRKVEF